MDGAEVAADKQTPRVRFTTSAAVAGLADVQFQTGARLSLSNETGVLGWDPGGGGHLEVRDDGSEGADELGGNDWDDGVSRSLEHSNSSAACASRQSFAPGAAVTHASGKPISQRENSGASTTRLPVGTRNNSIIIPGTDNTSRLKFPPCVEWTSGPGRLPSCQFVVGQPARKVRMSRPKHF